MSVVHNKVIHVFPRNYDPSKYFLTFKERFNLFTAIINAIPESLGFHERKENLVSGQSSQCLKKTEASNMNPVWI